MKKKNYLILASVLLSSKGFYFLPDFSPLKKYLLFNLLIVFNSVHAYINPVYNVQSFDKILMN